jgi:hypothetical protein
MVLLAGVGTAVVLRATKGPFWRPALKLLLLAASAHLVWQAWEQNTVYAADQRNPYVYAQTSPDILKLVAKVQSLAQAHPARNEMLMKVMAPEEDYWPLPWYFRGFKKIGWYEEVPDDPFAPVMIVAAKLEAGLDERKTHLMVGYFALRPQVFLELYVQKELWQNWLVKHPPQSGD